MISSAFSLVRRTFVKDDFDVRVKPADGFTGRLRFGAPHVFRAMENLTLQIGELDRIKIDQTQFADSRGRQVHGNGRAKAARANAQHAGGANFLLALQPDFGQTQMPRVAAQLITV